MDGLADFNCGYGDGGYGSNYRYGYGYGDGHGYGYGCNQYGHGWGYYGNDYGNGGGSAGMQIDLIEKFNWNARIITFITNAEIRQKIVNCLGIEKVCKDLNAKVIDKLDNYELLLLDLNDHRRRPYLKMINPSTRTYHIEGVPPNIKTVEGALAWRNRLDEYFAPQKLA